jgi:hypothetical protein
VVSRGHEQLIQKNEAEIAELLREIAERRVRDADHIMREWTTPLRETPNYVTRDLVEDLIQRAVVAAIAESDERLIERLANIAEVIGEEVAASVTRPMQRRISQLEDQLKALEGKVCQPTSAIIRP